MLASWRTRLGSSILIRRDNVIPTVPYLPSSLSYSNMGKSTTHSSEWSPGWGVPGMGNGEVDVLGSRRYLDSTPLNQQLLNVYGMSLQVLTHYISPHLDEAQLPAQELPHAVQRPVHGVGGPGRQQQQVALRIGEAGVRGKAGNTWTEFMSS